MKSIPTPRLNKDGYYSVRFRINRTLVPFLKREAINKSLKTKDYQEAKIKADTIYFKYRKILEVIKLLSEEQIEDIVNSYVRETLEEDKQRRALQGYGLVYAGEGGEDTPFEDSADASNDILSELLSDYRRALANSNYDIVEDEVKQILSVLDIGYDEDNLSHRLLMQRYLRGKIEVLEESISRNLSQFSKEYDKPYKSIYEEPLLKENEATNISLKEAFNKYDKWYSNADITTKQYNATINKLERTILPYFGLDICIDEISVDNIDEFKEYVETFPNISRLPYKHMDYQQLCEIAFIPEEDRISIDTQCKYLKIVKQFFKYLCDANLLSYNPCSLLRMPDAQNNKTEPFNLEDMHNLFVEFENLDDRKYIYYTLAYTGMRPNEFWKATINKEEGIYYFDLTSKNIDLKTPHSKRKIPLHSKLIEKDIHTKLIKLQKAYKQEKLSTYFNQTIKPKCIDDEANKKMYSFRHTVATELKRADVEMDKVSELLGHSYASKTMTKTVYASPYSLKQLKEAIENLTY